MNEQAGFSRRGRNPDVLTCIPFRRNAPEKAKQLLWDFVAHSAHDVVVAELVWIAQANHTVYIEIVVHHVPGRRQG
jgi:hypothetical protein